METNKKQKLTSYDEDEKILDSLTKYKSKENENIFNLWR